MRWRAMPLRSAPVSARARLRRCRVAGAPRSNWSSAMPGGRWRGRPRSMARSRPRTVRREEIGPRPTIARRGRWPSLPRQPVDPDIVARWLRRDRQRWLRVGLQAQLRAEPGRFAVLIGVPAAASLTIAASFASVGAWWILVFSVIELLALVAAFIAYARQAGAYERLLLTRGRLVVEINSGTATAARN